MTRARLRIWLVVALTTTAATLAAAGAVRVSSLARDGKVWITFELADGYTPEVRDAIHSGLPITFTYDIEMRRNVPFWPDRALASATIAVNVTYDNLTRRHSLSRSLDGRIELARDAGRSRSEAVADDGRSRAVVRHEGSGGEHGVLRARARAHAAARRLVLLAVGPRPRVEQRQLYVYSVAVRLKADTTENYGSP